MDSLLSGVLLNSKPRAAIENIGARKMSERRSSLPNSEEYPPQDMPLLDRFLISLKFHIHGCYEFITTDDGWLPYLHQQRAKLPPILTAQWWLHHMDWVLVLGGSLVIVTILLVASSAFDRHVEKSNGSTWFIDSTKAFHTTNSMDDFSTYKALNVSSPLLGDNSISFSLNGMEIRGVGTVKLEIPNWPDDTPEYHLLGVLYVPSQPKSVSLGVLQEAREKYHSANTGGGKPVRLGRAFSDDGIFKNTIDVRGIDPYGGIYRVTAFTR